MELLGEEGFKREEEAFLRGMESEDGRKERAEGRVKEILGKSKGAKL